MRGRAAATLALLLLAAVAAAAGALQAPPPPVVFLQLSDIHYSTNVRKYWRLFGDREGDAVLWAQSVVPRIAPAAVLVTGDLTDSKTARGEGLQQEAEWLAYAALLRNLSAAGVPEARVWDVPGGQGRVCGEAGRSAASIAPWRRRRALQVLAAGPDPTCTNLPAPQATTTPSICRCAAAPTIFLPSTQQRGGGVARTSSACTCTSCRRRRRRQGSSSSSRKVAAYSAPRPGS